MITRSHSPIHYRRSIAEIDLRKLERNFLAFKSLYADGTFICPMVKANAYGHGDIEVAKALRHAGAKYLGVALVEEGERLRRAGDREPILVFGPCDVSSAEAMLRENLTPVASDWRHLEALESALAVIGQERVVVHLEFNTGMNRLGFEPDAAVELRDWFVKHKEFRLEGICTHLLSGNDAGAESGESVLQLSALAKISEIFIHQPTLTVHALNSSGAVNVWKRLQDGKQVSSISEKPLGLRPGIGLYGIAPHNNERGDIALKPVMSLKTHIASIHRIAVGEKVSYGPTWVAARDSVIVTVPFGYADGYRRGLSNKASVLIRGRRARQVGTVCMDYFMVDVTDVETAESPIEIGEEIVLLGEQGHERITADELAEFCGTIAYEILTGISERVARTYLR